MQDTDWKTWVLIFLVVIGVAFEAIKRLPSGGPGFSLENLKFSATETATPYQVKHGRYKRPAGPPQMIPVNARAQKIVATVDKEALQKFVAQNSQAKEHQFGHADKGAEGKLADAKKKKKVSKLGPDEEWEIFVDPATGKRYRRKRKKALIVEQPATPAPTPTREEPRRRDDGVDGWMSEAIATGQLPPSGADQPDTPYEGFEEWSKRLLSQPDPAETRRFVEHYKNSLVTAEVFYRIVSMMIEDSRPQMNELGVLCAGLTPSVASYQVLADVVKNERSGSTTRTYTEGFLNRYSDLNNLHVLERVLRAPSNSFVALMATKSLDNSANRFLAPAANKPPKNATAQQLSMHSNSGYFKRFITILQGLSTNGDAQVIEQAKHTLSNINALMSPSGANPSTGTPGGDPPSVVAPTQASTQP